MRQTGREIVESLIELFKDRDTITLDRIEYYRIICRLKMFNLFHLFTVTWKRVEVTKGRYRKRYTFVYNWDKLNIELNKSWRVREITIRRDDGLHRRYKERLKDYYTRLRAERVKARAEYETCFDRNGFMIDGNKEYDMYTRELRIIKILGKHI